MRMIRILAAGYALFALTGVKAECVVPEDVEIPDGTISSYEEMRDSQTYVKAYMAEMEAYLECLDQQKAELEADIRQQSSDLTAAGAGDEAHLQRRLEAIGAMESVAARFNEQVRAYKLANP